MNSLILDLKAILGKCLPPQEPSHILRIPGTGATASRPVALIQDKLLMLSTTVATLEAAHIVQIMQIAILAE